MYLLPGTRGSIAKMYGELCNLECEFNSNTFRSATAARMDSVFSSEKLNFCSVLSLSNHKAVAVGLSTYSEMEIIFITVLILKPLLRTCFTRLTTCFSKTSRAKLNVLGIFPVLQIASKSIHSLFEVVANRR